MEEGRSDFKILTGTPTRNRILGRPRHRSEDNSRTYHKKIGINTRNWVYLAQHRDYLRALVYMVLNLRVPYAMELDSTLILLHTLEEPERCEVLWVLVKVNSISALPSGRVVNVVDC